MDHGCPVAAVKAGGGLALAIAGKGWDDCAWAHQLQAEVAIQQWQELQHTVSR